MEGQMEGRIVLMFVECLGWLVVSGTVRMVTAGPIIRRLSQTTRMMIRLISATRLTLKMMREKKQVSNV